MVNDLTEGRFNLITLEISHTCDLSLPFSAKNRGLNGKISYVQKKQTHNKTNLLSC